MTDLERSHAELRAAVRLAGKRIAYDAAHLYLTHVKSQPACGLPIPTTATTFEVITGGKIYHVSGVRLKAWIERRRQEWNGPRGFLFNQRPMIGN